MPALLSALVLVVFAMASCATSAEQGASAYFSTTYQEARRKFLAAAQAAGGELTHYLNPEPGAEGEALYTDVATFNLPKAERVLVLGSGTHGVEGFAGSALQVGLLRDGMHKGLPENVGLLFYHALNPYGFSHLRRFNEDNIDLNRNFVDHDKPHPVNDDYAELAWIVEPDALTTWENTKARIGLAWYRITRDARWLQSAISRGQYDHPMGIFFGGKTPSWSNHTLHQIIQAHLSRATRVILVDVHTGLGEYGAAEAITEILPGDPRYEWMEECWDTRVTNPRAGDAASPPISGPLKRGFARSLPDAEVIAVSLEFGTYPPLDVLWALRAENHLHHHGSEAHPEAIAIKQDLKRAFYPEQADWMQSVWHQGSRLARRTVECLR